MVLTLNRPGCARNVGTGQIRREGKSMAGVHARGDDRSDKNASLPSLRTSSRACLIHYMKIRLRDGFAVV